MVTPSPVGRGRIRKGAHQALIVSVSLLSSVLILVPIVWMVSAAVRPIKEIAR